MSNEVEQIIERVKAIAINYLDNVAKEIKTDKIEEELDKYEAHHHDNRGNIQTGGIEIIKNICDKVDDINQNASLAYSDFENFVNFLKKDCGIFSRKSLLSSAIAFSWVNDDLPETKLMKMVGLYKLVEGLSQSKNKDDALNKIQSYSNRANRGRVKNELVSLVEELGPKNSMGFWSCFSSVAVKVKDRGALQAEEKKDIAPGVSV